MNSINHLKKIGNFLSKKKISLYLKFLFSFTLIVFLAIKVDHEKLSLLKISFIPYYIVALSIGLLGIFVMAFRWNKLIMISIGQRNKVFRLYRYYLIGSFFNIFLPGAIGGDFARTKLLISRNNISTGKATIITVAERISGLYALLLLLSISFLFLNFPEKILINKHVNTCLLQASPILILCGVPIVKWILLKRRFYISYKNVCLIVGFSLLAQTGDIIIAFAFSNYFGLEIEFSAFFFIMPLVYFATVLPISLGGLGVREGAFSGLMILYGIDADIAIIISLLMYLTKLGIGFIGYFLYIKGK